MSHGKSHKLLRKTLIKDQKSANALELDRMKQTASIVPSLKDEINKLKDEIRDKDEKIHRDESEREIQDACSTWE